MKRHFLILLSLIILCFTLTGCSKSEEKAVVGTWYSDKPDTLVLDKDGNYSSQWLNNGKYTVKDGKLTLTNTNPMDGSTKIFEIKKDNGRTTFYYAALNSTYYDNQEEANKLIEKKAATEQTEKEAAETTAKKDVENNLVGTWNWAAVKKDVQFTGDGQYIFDNYKKNVWKYEIVDSKNLKITKDTGEVYNQPIKLTKTDNGYELQFPPMGTLVKK